MKDTLPESPVLNDSIALAEGAAAAAQSYATAAADALAVKVSAGDRISGKALEADQYAAHGLAWIATYAETLTQTAVWAKALDSEGQFGEMEALLMQIGMGEYLAQLS
ncbi:MAG: acyl-CoA dehydrogenase, partial [Pseudomonadota bacterium]